VKVHWTDTARDHLRAIHTYVARNSPSYARRVVDRLTRRSQQIAEFPLSGREVPEFAVPQIRQVLEGPFRIIYYIKPNQIDVLAVIHGAQQIPPASNNG
jgi:plasmid stabilization system protein ParE